ncbi:hypothetical protein CP532_0478, partial [Ophiocordyceps camponoti-leonardi (nom. inval.)]
HKIVEGGEVAIPEELLTSIADSIAAGDGVRFLTLLGQLQEAGKPETVEETVDRLRRVSTTSPMNSLHDIVALISNGLFSGSLQELLADAVGLTSGMNSQNNSNPDPPRSLYPSVNKCDAPYSIPEDRLRAAIYIPLSFSNGKKAPVILVPNAGNTGYTTYRSSFIPLLTDPKTTYADPVWLNLPAFATGDLQVYAEYVAYAIHYVASRTGRNVTLVGFGQASVTNQWALKYWPSTRTVTGSEFTVSGDYHGSMAALPSSVVLSGIGNVPALIQQWNQSHFIRSLRSHRGGSAYVPTTSVYTGFEDDMVQPQSGPRASAIIEDERGVGVTNAEVQVVCRGKPAGGFYNFASVLLNPLVHALFKDVMTNGGGKGPGKMSRLDLKTVCSSYLAPGLVLNDLLTSQKYLLVDLVSIAMNPNKTLVEPVVKPYARRDPDSAFAAGDGERVGTLLRQVTPGAKPSSVQEAVSRIQAISTANGTIENIALRISQGLFSGSIESILSPTSLADGPGSSNNNNPPPPTTIYPSVSPCDAPYTVSEQALRSAIYIPSTFTNGTKTPVIIVPIAGNTGYSEYNGNIITQLANSDYADPVWVNVPTYSIPDIQVNAEYVAYVMHYIASRTGRNVTMMSYGQGSLTTGWALKYWPSTRNVTSSDFAINGVYKGSDAVVPNTLVNVGLGAVPSIIQQKFESNFIQAFRSNGGDSAYLPSTSIYSSFYDILVQPQSGTGASAYRGDARAVGVTNAEVQVVCAGRPAGSFYDGSGLSVHPLPYALLRDAIANGGPGRLSRIDLNQVCSTYLAPGLGLENLLSTQNFLISAAVRVIPYLPKSLVEPAIKPYASVDPDGCTATT